MMVGLMWMRRPDSMGQTHEQRPEEQSDSSALCSADFFRVSWSSFACAALTRVQDLQNHPLRVRQQRSSPIFWTKARGRTGCNGRQRPHILRQLASRPLRPSVGIEEAGQGLQAAVHARQQALHLKVAARLLEAQATKGQRQGFHLHLPLLHRHALQHDQQQADRSPVLLLR
eukprot:scaffold2930_cov244-Pinguiococcus_pyrenoidosus.AAC.4